MNDPARRGASSDIVVHVAGEIDISNAAELQEKLESVSTDRRMVIVELSQVTFFDASGLSALVRGRTAAVMRGGSLILVDVPPFLLRLLAITSLEHLLTVAPEA